MPDDLDKALAETRDELDRLRLTLQVVGTVDLDVGILNENGIVDAIDRARRWHARRGDVFGVLAIVVPDLGDEAESAADVAATIAAGLREVDDVGRLGPDCFVGILSDLAPGSLGVVADRIRGVLSRQGARPSSGAGERRIGGLEMHRSDTDARTILQRAVALARTASGAHPLLERQDPA